MLSVVLSVYYMHLHMVHSAKCAVQFLQFIVNSTKCTVQIGKCIVPSALCGGSVCSFTDPTRPAKV